MNRTPEQIRNLRNVMNIIYGPYANFVDDEDVDKWGNALQKNVDENNIGLWEIRVRHSLNSQVSWTEIEKEPKVVKTSMANMRAKCEDLLNKYPDIIAIQISDRGDRSNIYVFDRT